MDLISSLPPELSQKILLLLSVRDLFNCMTVSKYWRSLINCDYIWSHYFKVLDLEGNDEELPPSEFSGIDGLLPLCSRASELKNYLLSPANNWRNNDFKHTSINLKYRHWRAASYQTYLAIMYLSVSELHTFHVLQSGVMISDIISVNLPKNSVDQPILMNSKYIVLGAYNITLIYKLVASNFTLFKAFAIKYDPALQAADEDFDNFVKECLLSNHCVFERALLDDTLWITDATGNKHIIDLTTGKTDIFSTLLLYTKVFSVSKYILNFTDVNILITDRNASVISSFSVRHMDKTFYSNSNVLCICFPRFVINNTIMIECREICSGDLIRQIGVPERTRITLHPSKDILLSLSTLPGLYTVLSTCIKTGDILWKYEVDLGPHMFWGSFLSMISNRYLVVFPGPSSDDFFALFNLKGELLYESCLTSGIIIYFSDLLVVAKEEGRLYLMICK